MRTTAKRNPITGEPVPAPAYARGTSKNFAGTDRKRESMSDGFYTAGERNAKMKADKALVKQLDDSFRADQKRYKTEAATKEKAEKIVAKKDRKNQRIYEQARKGRSRGTSGGGKKNMDGDKSNRQRTNAPGQRSQNRDCKIKMRNR